jgi:hypothetical protein
MLFKRGVAVVRVADEKFFRGRDPKEDLFEMP